jgi:hypothetical protein
MEEREISDVVFDFIENMDALNQSALLVLSVVATVASKMTNAHGEYLEKYGKVTEQDDEKKVYSVPIERQSRVNHLRERSGSLRSNRLANYILHRAKASFMLMTFKHIL